MIQQVISYRNKRLYCESKKSRQDKGDGNNYEVYG